MTREQVWDIIGDIDDRFIAEAAQYDPKKCSRSPERIRVMSKKRLITFVFAAALILALGVGAYAAYDVFSGPKAAERVALEQLEVWQELGLISPEIRFESPATYIKEQQARQGSDYWYGRLFPHCFDVRFSNDKYVCQLQVDTLTGKIVLAMINAHPDETDEQVAVESRGDSKVFYVYDNFDDIFPADLTVDGFCSLLADYWGFSGYRIADTLDNYFPEYERRWDAIDGSTLLKDMPKTNPTDFYLTVFFEGDQEGAPMYIELGNFPDYVVMTIGNHHSIG